MAVERAGPYIWVTWLTKLMAGENQCEWASWFRAHYEWDKLPGDFDLAKWTTEHNALLHERRKQLQAEGLTVYTEDQNSFRVEGKTGIVVSGKADIVAITEDVVFVEDCKIGDPKNSDHMQVMIYLLLLPLALDYCKGRNLEGRIIYNDATVDVTLGKVDDEFKQLLKKTVLKVGGTEPPKKAPSWGECRYCDISKADCPERIEVEPTVAADEHDLF
jgi:hypothetical protein